MVPLILKDTYEAAIELNVRIGLFVELCQQGTPGPFGPVYAEIYNAQGQPLETVVAPFGATYQEWLDTATWTVATSAPLPVHNIGDPLLTTEESESEKVTVHLASWPRGRYNGGTWGEYTPPIPPPEE